MAYFARKLRYGAHDGESGAQFMALIALAKKKGGKPVEFLLYQRIIQFYYPAENLNRMVRLKAVSAEEAIRRFWPWGGETGKEFPGWESDQWEKTTLWLYPVAVGGGYEQFASGTWVRATTPNPWSGRRKGARIKACDTACHLRQLETELKYLESQFYEAQSDMSCAEYNSRNYDDPDFEEHNRLIEATSRAEIFGARVDELKLRVCQLTDELRFTKAKKFGVPYWPRQQDGKLKKAA